MLPESISSPKSIHSFDLDPEPDLHPLYPSTPHIAVHLSSHSGLNPDQKAELVRHSLSRACVFAELSVLQYLFSDPQAQPYLDLAFRDDDGVGLVSLTIHGFGSDSERDIEREECVRLLVAQGADLGPDKAGWTPLHHAALLSPPSLISFLMTHGCSPFDVTRRNLTALDIVTAHSLMPGRADVALLLEEAMRGEGWTGGRMEQKRRQFDELVKRKERQQVVREDVGKILGILPRWWGTAAQNSLSDSDSEDDEDDDDDDGTFYTPSVDYTSMLVFSPFALPGIFENLITNYPPSFRDAQPANVLYMLARFACLTCDHNWLEDFMLGATEAIEDCFFNHPDDITCLVFWLYNTTVWLHLMQCDNSINEACEMLGSLELIEETINSVFVFIIRLAERKIDEFLDTALLDYQSLGSEFDSIQFESEWSFLRSLTGKKKNATVTPNSTLKASSSTSHQPPSPGRASSPTLSTSSSRGFSSFTSTFSRNRASSSATPLQSIFPDAPPPPSPTELTSYLTALHTLLTLSEINPALTTQLWSQVMYWTSCELFNRIITRKKYLCRSRAVQIGMNLGVLEEWVGQMGLPRGVQSHFAPVRDLLNWLQCLSSITEFPDLVATIQTMKNINPLQMRRAVRDYKYEVNEGRMTEECVQYLTQLQKDWERHRVKLGVEALRKEMGDREREREGSVSSFATDSPDNSGQASSISASSSSDILAAQEGIDLLFDRGTDKSSWEPPQPPKVLGELLDSRYMLPLVFPSNPRMLGASPGNSMRDDDDKRSNVSDSRSASRSSVGAMSWRAKNRKLRNLGSSVLKWVDGAASASRWGRPVVEEEEGDQGGTGEDVEELDTLGDLQVDTSFTPLTRKRSGKGKGRPSLQAGETTPVDQRT